MNVETSTLLSTRGNKELRLRSLLFRPVTHFHHNLGSSYGQNLCRVQLHSQLVSSMDLVAIDVNSANAGWPIPDRGRQEVAIAGYLP